MVRSPDSPLRERGKSGLFLISVVIIIRLMSVEKCYKIWITIFFSFFSFKFEKVTVVFFFLSLYDASQSNSIKLISITYPILLSDSQDGVLYLMLMHSRINLDLWINKYKRWSVVKSNSIIFACTLGHNQLGHKPEQNLVHYLDFTERWRGEGVNLN